MLILLLWSTLVAAETPKWWCTLNAQATGRPEQYMLYGRDEWSGDTVMRCQRSGEERMQLVNFCFSSKNKGFGANASSVITFNVTLWTDSDPAILSIDTSAPGLVSGANVYWHLSSEQGDIAAEAWTGSDPGVTASLELGVITIKSLLFRGQ